MAGALTLAVSLALGAWARELASADALAGWLREHPPSPLAWRHALASRGFREVTDPSAHRRASRPLPTLVDQEGSAWIGAGGGWIALFIRQDDGSPHRLYCLECDSPPSAWAPAGVGWAAFDPVAEAADQAVARMKERKPAKTAAKPRPARDPRELLY